MEWSNNQKKNYIFDPDTRTVYLGNKRATDMWANQRVKLVKPDFDENKTKRDNLKVEIICVYNEYMKDNYF